MNTVLCTMIDTNFLKGYKVFIKSLLRYNKWFRYPILIIDCGLTKEDREECKKLYAKTTFEEPKFNNYKSIDFRKTEHCLKKTFYKLEIFSYINYDRLIFMDSDILILGDISYLFSEIVAPFSGCKAYNAHADKFRGDINTGLLVLNKASLNLRIYNKLLHMARKGFSMPDQKVINLFFKQNIYNIPKIYNVEKRIKGSGFLKYKVHEGFPYIQGKKVKVLHFVSQKPWEEKKNKENIGFEDLEKLWLDHEKELY